MAQEEHAPGDRDVTVLRADSSLSAPSISHGAGEDASGVEIPKVLKQRFVLEDKLGSGGMGTVFRAKDLRKVEARDNQPHIAVKVLNNNFRTHPEAFVALEREASKSQTLRHSNIVSIFDFDKDGSVPFITMELLEGRELGDLLKAYPNGLPDEMAWSVVRGIVAGLVHAHGEHVVHADFKPGNVFVTSSGQAKILDFGIARAIRMNRAGQESDTEFDPARLAALTPAYASREMLNGDNPEPRDDLYSLGVVVYMVFTGHHPYGRLNANEAAHDKLKPERVRRLSRRQWRVLERCLAFNRQNRPESAEEVHEALFGKSSWHSWGLAAGLAALTIALAATTLSGSEELDQVKLEVRQNTLVDAQVARITELLESPDFDDDWNRRIFSELQTLKTLAPNHAYGVSLAARARELYAEEIRRSGSADRAFELYETSLRLGPMDEAAKGLVSVLAAEAQALVGDDVTDEWLVAASGWIERANLHFPHSVELALRQLELIDHLGTAIPRISASSVALAEAAYELYSSHSFDSDELDVVEDEVSSALAQQHEDEEARLLDELRARTLAEFDEFLNVSCLRLDVALLAAQLQTVQAKVQHSVKSQIRPRVQECIKRLGAVDPDRAFSMQQEALARLGTWLELDKSAIDPCGMEYLVGNGQQRGRAGYCSDDLGGTDGPRLVVVPGVDNMAKFAISKYEVSWRELGRYCRETGECEVEDDSELPVTNVPVETALGYVDWLTRKSGYRYRLPSIEEWSHAAQGTPDPNRNCRVDAVGVTRGYNPVPANAGSANVWGILHVLGNVQELVAELADLAAPGDEPAYVAVGGAYADPIDVCLAATKRTAESAGDDMTGFRVVRELT